MRVVVTGAAGFIGSHVVEQLLGRGDPVCALVGPSGAGGRLPASNSQLKVHKVDLTDASALRAALGTFDPEAAIHLAWYADPETYLTSKENLRSLHATCTFLEVLSETSCRKLVAAGTSLEYAPGSSPRRESDPVLPISLYASCKHAGWLVARAMARSHDFELAWGRIFHVHGPNEHPARVVSRVASSLRRGLPIDLSPGMQVRDHLHVSDVASAIITLLPAGTEGVFNVCSGLPVTLREVLSAVAGIVGRPDLLQFGARPYSIAEPMFLVGDPSRLHALGFAPRYPDLLAGLADALRERTP